jgi:hypothetical protein
MTVSFDLTGTQGSRNFTESGGFTSVYTTPQSPSDSSESERIGDRLTLSFRGKRDTAAARALARRRPLSRPRPWFRHDGAGTALARVSMGSVRTRQSRT